MAGIHVGVGIASGEVSRDVERGGVRNVLLHSRQIRSNPHSGDDAARVLTARSQKRPPTGHESRLPPCRVEHAAKLWIGPVTSGAYDDRLASPDVDRLGAILDTAVLPETLQASPGLRIEPRRIAGPYSDNAAGELLLAN